MSLELIREEIKVNRIIASTSTQAIVQNDIIVPDVKPDIARILLIDGEPRIKSADAAQDKILVNGSIDYKILYTSDDEDHKVKSINTTCDFSCSIDSPGIKQGIKCHAKCDLEHIEYEILNGRKLSVKSIVSVAGKANEESVLDVVTDFSSANDIQLLRSNININSYIGDAQDEYTVRESLEIPAGKPAIREILRNDVKLSGKDYKVTDGKLIARGVLNVSTLYIADDEAMSIQSMEYEIPFSQIVNIPGIDENSICEVEYKIDSQQFEVGEDADGEPRVLLAEILLSLYASAYSQKSIDTIEDAYSPAFQLLLEKKAFNLENTFAENKSQLNLKETVVLPDGYPEISEIFNVLNKPAVIECKVYDDRISIEGIVTVNMLYLSASDEQPLYCYIQEIPFKHSIDIKGAMPGMNPDITLDVEHCSYSMLSPNRVELRMVVGISVRLSSITSIPLIVKAVDAPMDDKRSSAQPSIIIYFVRPGDTLWKIAKKYASTTADIIKMNSLNENESLYPGQQILIAKKAQ